VERVRASTLPPRLRETLTSILKFNRFGTELWPSTLKVAVAAGVSYRTVQRHIDRLVKLEVLAEVFPANTRIRGRGFRPSATYTLRPEKLVARQTVEEWEESRSAVAPFRPPKQEAKKPAAPTPTPARQTVPFTRRKIRQLTTRERAKLIQSITHLMKGRTQHMEIGGYGYDLKPEDPRYRAPLCQVDAIRVACQNLLIPIESAIEALRLAGFSVRDIIDAGGAEIEAIKPRGNA